jgi:hypothetical protein
MRIRLGSLRAGGAGRPRSKPGVRGCSRIFPEVYNPVKRRKGDQGSRNTQIFIMRVLDVEAET